MIALSTNTLSQHASVLAPRFTHFISPRIDRHDWHFFQQHSIITDPGSHQDRLIATPAQPTDLVEITGRLVLDFIEDRLLVSPRFFSEHFCQIDLRTVPAMLAALEQLSPTPPATLRTPDQRITGTSRDASVLCCSVLRSHGIPARVRYGFVHRLYNRRNYLQEHTVTEYIQPDHLAEPQWHSLDCRINSETIQRWSLTGSPCVNSPEYLTKSLFYPALTLWRECRNGKRNFAQFSPCRTNSVTGMWHLCKLVYQDIASLNGFESLMWDTWGPPSDRTRAIALTNPEELQILDAVAFMDTYQVQDCTRIRQIYQQCDMLKVPSRILSFSPHLGVHTWSH